MEEDVRAHIAGADRIYVYAEGVQSKYVRGTEEFSCLLRAWEEMTADALQMPAFGVSIDKMTRKDRMHGVWVEFVFEEQQCCSGLPFDSLLIKTDPAFKGINLIRQYKGEYTGRCIYLDLGGRDMASFSACLKGFIFI